MTRHHVSLSSCELSIDHDAVRMPPRPVVLRHESYEDDFDFTTLFYDCFWNARHDAVILVGPPSCNLPQDLDLTIYAYPSGAHCERQIMGSASLSRAVAEVPADTTALVFQAGKNAFYVTPQPNLGSLFEDRRVITTINKNNEIQWIRDWIQFYRKKHGCNGVLLYDNESTLYSIADLYDALTEDSAEIPIVIIPWNFKWGVFDFRRSVSYLMADGSYCQKGMLEHARWRFLRDSKSVVNVDIDELVITENGSSVFDIAETSPTGLIILEGKWVENYPPTTSSTDMRRHKDFGYVERCAAGCEPKWAVVPHKVPDAAQWFVHFIYGMSASEPERRAEIRHFKALNTNWSLDRARSTHVRTVGSLLKVEKLYRDPILQAALNDVFVTEVMAPS